MAQRTFVGAAKRALLAAGCLLLFTPMTVSPAWATFPCVDVNTDGECTAGVDTDISAAVAEGFFSTDGDILVPEKAKDVVLKGDLSLFANGKITVHGKMKAQSISLGAGRELTIADKAVLRSNDSVDLTAGTDVVIGQNVVVASGDSAIYVSAWGGSVTVGAGSKLAALDTLDVQAFNGVVDARDAKMHAPQGSVYIAASGDVYVTDSSLRGQWIMVDSGASLVDFKNNVVKLKGDGMVSISTAGSTVDLRGTKFKNVSPSNIWIDAEHIMQ